MTRLSIHLLFAAMLGLLGVWGAKTSIAQERVAPQAVVELTPKSSTPIPIVSLVHLNNGAMIATLNDAQMAFAAGDTKPAEASDFGVDGATHWLGLAISNAGDTPSVHHLHLGRPYQLDAEVVVDRGDALEVVLHENRAQPFGERLVPTRILTSTEIALAPGETVQLWIRHAVEGSSLPNWSLLTPEDLQSRQTQELVFFALFYGVALVLALFMLAFFFVFRTRAQFFFLGFFVFLLAYNAQLDGRLFAVVWPNAPIWNAYASHYIGLTGIASAMLAAHAFVGGRQNYPVYNAAVLGTLGAISVFFVLPTFVPLGQVKSWVALVMLAFLILHLVATFLAIRDRPGGWLLFALGSFALAIVMGLFTVGTQISGTLPPIVVISVLRYGQLLDGALFNASAIVQAMGLRRMLAREQEVSEAIEAELVATRHDLQQPLLAMRDALTKLEKEDRSAEDIARLDSGIRFIERLAQPGGTKGVISDEEAIDLQVILDGVVTLLGPEADAAGVDLKALPTRASVTGDPLVIFRAMTNLTSNALRHSGSRKVRIGARGTGAHLRLFVADQGQGFDPSKIEVSNDAAHGHGIASSRRALEQGGFGMKIKSTPGGGTCAMILTLDPSTS